MTVPTTLAIGPYPEPDRSLLASELGAAFAGSPTDVVQMPETLCAGIRAVAYRGHLAFGGAEMDLLPGLQLIANFGVGYDSIDVAAATARAIKVTNTPDVLSDDVADLAVGLLLTQLRQMRHGDALVRSGRWSTGQDLPLNRKASGARAGILGLGRIGREIADRLAAFKMDIHYWARSEKPTPGWTWHADPVSLAGSVDFLVVALVGGEGTRNMVSRQVLAALGPRGILINISRGSTVDEGALLDALESGGIAGAGLDVFWNEPRIDPRFLALDNVALQPHQGSGTVETRADMARLQRDNIAALLAGAPLLTPVN